MAHEAECNAMETLREVRLLRQKTERDRERARRIRMEIGPAADAQDGAGPAASLAEIERGILADILDAERKIAEIARTVDELPASQAMTMRLRYFDGLSWRQVAREMHYTVRRCMQLHEEAEKRLGDGARPES